MKYTSSDSECQILTFKDGVFSAAAHDLRLCLERFEIDVSDPPSSVSARFDASSIRVLCAVKDGTDDYSTLTDKNKREIEKNIIHAVLNSDSFPEITFQSTEVRKKGSQLAVRGTLTIRDHVREISFQAQESQGRITAEIALTQTDFGIQPFSALFGTIKLKSEIRVLLSVPK